MIISIGIAFIAAGAISYALSRRKQNQMIGNMRREVMRSPISPVYKPGEIASLYLQMQDKSAKDEKNVKILKLIAVCSLVVGVVIVGVGLIAK